MTVFYSHQLGVINCAALKSLFNTKLMQKLEQEKRFSASELKKIKEDLSQEARYAQINLFKDLKLDFLKICSWLQSVTDELKSENMFLCIKGELRSEMNKETLTLASTYEKALSAYAETLLDKGKVLIYNRNYGFNPTTIHQTIEVIAGGWQDEKLQNMPLYFNMHYFILEHGSHKLVEPQVLQEMFLLRYFNTIKSYVDAKVLSKEDVEKAFKAYI